MNHRITPRIYIACLAAYNNGILHGCWIDATQPLETINTAMHSMLASSPIPNAEEWAIHDVEGFHHLSISEYAGLETIHPMAIFIDEHGALGAALLSYCDHNTERAEQMLDEQYHGIHSSIEAFAEEITDETSDIPTHLAYYIDYAAIARDMQLNGDILVIEIECGEVHIFWNS